MFPFDFSSAVQKSHDEELRELEDAHQKELLVLRVSLKDDLDKKIKELEEKIAELEQEKELQRKDWEQKLRDKNQEMEDQKRKDEEEKKVGLLVQR